jgi:Tol biopolymer transport system component
MRQVAINVYRLKVLLVLLLAATVAAGLLVLVGTKPAKAAFSGANGKIAFTSTRTTGEGVDNPTADPEIFTMNPNGTEITQLTFNTATDVSPSFSPNGRELVFISTRDGNREVYVMSPDGSNQERLTNNTTYEDNPAISPSGSKVAYESLRDNNFEIIVKEGPFETNLTNNAATDSSPAWSPDGSKIAFHSRRDSGNFEIYVMNALDGSRQKNRTVTGAYDVLPDWGVAP